MDQYNLNRFIEAQMTTYEEAMLELTRGRKESHWVWYIFPQIEGLGRSDTAKLYSIKSLEEGRAYLEHLVLGPRLVEACEILLSLKDASMEEKSNMCTIFSSELIEYIDDDDLKDRFITLATSSLNNAGLMSSSAQSTLASLEL